MWLTFALASAAIYGVAETIDNFFANKEFKHPLTLVFYASLFSLIYFPLLYLVQPPSFPPLHTLPLFILVGFVNVGYLYPYYQGLKVDDTSVAISFLAMERIMVPVLAFFIVGEVLAPTQYLGIAIIVASVIMLGFHHARGRFRFSKAVWYIFWASLFLAVEGVLYKVLLDQGISVGTVLAGEAVFSFIFGMSVVFSHKIRRDISASFSIFAGIFLLFLLEEVFTFFGNFTEGQAISIAPVSLVKAVSMTSSFFLILYAWLGASVLPFLFKENLHRKNVAKKLALFAILIVGVVLVKGN